MDDVSFENAPVVELIAELRWMPPGLAPMAAGQVTIAMGRETEEFFLRFGAEVAKHGYTQAEKLVPAGFPAILHQVSWRFRKPGDQTTLLQVGPGLFSANALQPYRRWKDFRPTVELGVAALLTTRVEAEKAVAFSGTSLRYMNAFTGPLLSGKVPHAFIADVLGFKLALPKSVGDLIDPKRQVSTSANLLLPIANTSKVMSLAIGDGLLNTEAAAMFDITVAEQNPVPATTAEVMTALSASRDIIHDCFLKLTEPLKQLMKPKV